MGGNQYGRLCNALREPLLKITIDLPDELANAAKTHAASQNLTLRALIERGLRMVLRADREAEPFRLRDASVGGRGLQPAFRDAAWSQIREAIYEGRGS